MSMGTISERIILDAFLEGITCMKIEEIAITLNLARP